MRTLPSNRLLTKLHEIIDIKTFQQLNSGEPVLCNLGRSVVRGKAGRNDPMLRCDVYRVQKTFHMQSHKISLSTKPRQKSEADNVKFADVRASVVRAVPSHMLHVIFDFMSREALSHDIPFVQYHISCCFVRHTISRPQGL